jgi:hypothetical protein
LPKSFYFKPFSGISFYSINEGDLFMLPIFYKEFKVVASIFWSGALLLILMGTLGAGSMKDKEEIQVTGRIYVMGNEPFTQVAIQQDDGKVYALTGEYDKEFRRLQGKRVTVNGKLRGKTTRGVDAIEVKSFQGLEQK